MDDHGKHSAENDSLLDGELSSDADLGTQEDSATGAGVREPDVREPDASEPSVREPDATTSDDVEGNGQQR